MSISSSAFVFPPQSNVTSDGVSESLWNNLATVVEARTMMQFGTERRNHLIGTVIARARATRAADATAYIKNLLGRGAEAEMNILIDNLTINETTFFRNVPQLEMVSKIAIPELVARKNSDGKPKCINVWSSACSTGQEVYTLAMLGYEALKFLPGWEVKVFGTDISPTVLDIARKGLYAKARLDTVPPGMLQRYFDDLGDEIRVKDILRKVSSFQQHNLREAFPSSTFDIIFCRNVMIYFSREEQAKLAQRFYERLSPGGFLVIGHSESLQGMGVDLRLRIHERGVAYQKG